MEKAEYDLLRQKFEQDFRANVEALDRVFAAAQAIDGVRPVVVNPAAPPVPIVPETVSTNSDSAEKGVIIAAIRRTLPQLPRRFTWRDVKGVAETENAGMEFLDSSVRQAVMRLVETGEIVIVDQGAEGG